MLVHSGGGSIMRVLRQTPTTLAAAPAEISSSSRLQETKKVFILLAMETNTEGSGENNLGLSQEAHFVRIDELSDIEHSISNLQKAVRPSHPSRYEQTKCINKNDSKTPNVMKLAVILEWDSSFAITLHYSPEKGQNDLPWVK